MEQNIYLYLELEGEDLDIIPLYDLFAKCSCFGSPVGDTYYTYDADGEKRARKRTAAYFQARIEYRTQGDPLNDILSEFLNIYCYDGAPLRALIDKGQVKLWCSVSSDAPQVPMTLKPGSMRRLAELGLELKIVMVQRGKLNPRT